MHIELLFMTILQEVCMLQLQTQDMVSMVGALMDSILLTLHCSIHPQALVVIPLKFKSHVVQSICLQKEVMHGLRLMLHLIRHIEKRVLKVAMIIESDLKFW